MYGLLHTDAVHLNILAETLKLQYHVGSADYHRPFLEVVLLQIQMYVGLAVQEQQQTGLCQLIYLALTEESGAGWPSVQNNADDIIVEDVTLCSGLLLQVNGADGEVIQILVAIHTIAYLYDSIAKLVYSCENREHYGR